MDWRDYIEQMPGVTLGKPIFKGTRITVEFVLGRLAQGATMDGILKSYPSLTREHLKAAIAYAA